MVQLSFSTPNDSLVNASRSFLLAKWYSWSIALLILCRHKIRRFGCIDQMPKHIFSLTHYTLYRLMIFDSPNILLSLRGQEPRLQCLNNYQLHVQPLLIVKHLWHSVKRFYHQDRDNPKLDIIFYGLQLFLQ